MFQPDSVMHNSAYFYIEHLGDGDIRWEYRPWAERWNPLRYSIGIRFKRHHPPSLRINRKGWAYVKVSNLLYRIRQLGDHSDAQG